LIENLIGNVRPAQQQLIEHKLATDADIRSGIDELSALMANPSGSAFFYWNRAVGVNVA
jgi:hypothetical protein